MGWLDDKKRMDKHIPQIKRYLADLFVREATVSEDQEQATDLLVLEVRPLRVACRVRRWRNPNNGMCYFNRYGNQFTVRVTRPNGMLTELGKFRAGWGDYMFYGWESEDDSRLCAYHVFDLRVFCRTLWLHESGRRPITVLCRENHDGSSDFNSYFIRDFLPGFIFNCYIDPGLLWP